MHNFLCILPFCFIGNPQEIFLYAQARFCPFSGSDNYSFTEAIGNITTGKYAFNISQPITLEMIIQLGMMRAKVRSNYRAFRTHFDAYATPLMMVSLQNRIHTLSNEIKTLNAIIATQKDKSL